MPDGTTEPGKTAADLDQWCARHLDKNHGARHNACHGGTDDCMVSAHLPTHTLVTEITSLTRTAAYLIERGGEATEAEREAYEFRKKTLISELTRWHRGSRTIRTYARPRRSVTLYWVA